MIGVNLQARRILSASLLLFLLIGCQSAQATPTLRPSETPAPQLISSPTKTPTASALQRADIETYTVQPGDTIESVASSFNLKPETVLWANYSVLFDSPDFLFTGMQLTILPVDGVYHQVGGTDTLTSIANFFAADPQAVINWPANHIDANNPIVLTGQWLMVPGGRRALRRRLMPNLPRFAMAVSFEEFGSGACPQNSSLKTEGDGSYAWPVAEHALAGDGFWSAHQAADLAAEVGEEVHAADDGVVVFSGWSNFGYGNMVMLDHGNGNFSLYSGLAEASALCGHSVVAGEVIGIAGSTGHPAGTYVHFEIRRGDENVDPLIALPNN